jgi:hypothetical protein
MLIQIGPDCSVGQSADRHTRQVALHVGIYLTVGERHGRASARTLHVRQPGHPLEKDCTVCNVFSLHLLVILFSPLCFLNGMCSPFVMDPAIESYQTANEWQFCITNSNGVDFGGNWGVATNTIANTGADGAPLCAHLFSCTNARRRKSVFAG